jgi:DNA polymerase-3 subunit gamma/tau
MSEPQQGIEPPTAEPPTAEPPTGGLTLGDVRRLWPDIVEATKLKRRVTWIHLTQHAQVVAVDAKTLTLGFQNAGARESFANGGSAEIVRQAAIDVVGTDWKVEAIVDPGASPGGGSPTAAMRDRGQQQVQSGADRQQESARPVQHDQEPRQQGPGGAPDVTDHPGAVAKPAAEQNAAAPSELPPWATDDAPAHESSAASAQPVIQTRETMPPGGINAAREAISTTRTRPVELHAARGDVASADEDVDRDDPDIEGSGLSGAELLQRTLGAQIIEEIRHD